MRGCIGSLEAFIGRWLRTLPRTPSPPPSATRVLPLTEEELERTRVEVSLLEKSEAIEFKDEADALAQLRPGLDGLILTNGSRRATFLPQVWESLPEPQRFMSQLKPAGLPAYFWDEDIALARYGVQKWKET